MDLCQLLVAVAIVFPQNQHELRSRYERRILLIAAKVIQTMELFEQYGEKLLGSDPKIGEILKKYHETKGVNLMKHQEKLQIESMQRQLEALCSIVALHTKRIAALEKHEEQILKETKPKATKRVRN